MLLLLTLTTVLGCSLGARLPYIVNGYDVPNPGKWPWQASLQFDNQHSCGAVVISSRWLVTAAHCVGFGNPDQHSIVLGMHDLLAMQQGQPRRYAIKDINVHPGWDSMASGFPNDIAVLELMGEADLSTPYASTIQLASSDQTFMGATCYITGWGRLYAGGPLSDILQETKVEVYTNEYCKSQYSGNQIGPMHICVGNYGKSGSCSSDSGGPLSCKTGNAWTLAGVTSWGSSDCSVFTPDVYTRISYYRDWIRQMSGV